MAMALAIEASDLGFSYPDGTRVLEAVDWTVEEGAFQLLVGATGSGKTTLLRQVVFAVAPAGERTGRLHVFGTDPASRPPREAAQTAGYVFQDPASHIVCDTVERELAFGLQNLGVEPSLMRRRLAEVAHFFGIEPWLHRATAELSGGQQQVLALAACLALRPRIVLLDEPTAQLDPVAEKNFLHGLFRVNRELGVTVVVATHAPDVMADYATDAVALEGGRASRVPLDAFRPRPLRGAGVRAAAPAGVGAGLAVDVRDAWVRFGKTSPWVLRGLDAAVPRGSHTALLGGNGSGKTTLLKAIAQVMRPERGSVKNALTKGQAFLPQDPRLLFMCDSTIEELQEWQRACGYGDAAVDAMLKRCGLESRAAVHPYDLSGGERQKLALAKLLLTKPSLLLLDEPTKGLDGASKAEVAGLIEEARAAGATVVSATHDLAFARLCATQVALLFDGQVAAAEAPEAFFCDNVFYRPLDDAFARCWRARHEAADARARAEKGDAPGGEG
ncbi:ATP-binding cassette domain-containing protein [Eggerthellaceae bacterium zg-886]|uniref:ATP-binding cassette domain-containing protein n=2 Tax=Xiamenia xianingshaonis TaxID=2682776 RepID=A0ABX0IH27_9ACTN|nr:ATP-binding cassette domain-containing protein [Xiamenia xianingshaonis]